MFSEADRARVGVAVTAAEASSDGEIVTIVAQESDSYNDVVAHWAVMLMLLGVALVAAMPARFILWLDVLRGGWDSWTSGELIAILLGALALVFLIGRAIFGIRPIRLALTLPNTKASRVRRRALLLFRLTAENRTRGKTGVLLYLSLAERRAELVADAAITAKVSPETWGDAMAALIDAVKDGRPGDGMVASIGKIGQVLAEHFPRSPDDTNELPDRLILL
jgi:putative membrane protein